MEANTDREEGVAGEAATRGEDTKTTVLQHHAQRLAAIRQEWKRLQAEKKELLEKLQRVEEQRKELLRKLNTNMQCDELLMLTIDELALHPKGFDKTFRIHKESYPSPEAVDLFAEEIVKYGYEKVGSTCSDAVDDAGFISFQLALRAVRPSLLFPNIALLPL